MNIPSFDDFLATLTDEDMEKIVSQANVDKTEKDLNPKTNFDMMSALSITSAKFCISATFALLRHYHDWLSKVLL